MKRIIVLFAFFASFAEKIVGHPYSQRLISGQYPYFNQPAVTTYPESEKLQYGSFSYPSQAEYQRQASISGQSQCATCPYQRQSYQSSENLPYSVQSYGIPQRYVRSVVETTRVPVVERMEVPFSFASNPSENGELPYMRSVISALEALGLGQITIPSERKASTRLENPVGATIPSTPRDHAPKKTQSQNSQFVSTSPEGYDMYYNMRMMSFNSMPDKYPDQINTATNSEAKESKVDEQQDKVLAGIEQLLMGELMVLSQQEEMESLVEREFENQEMYLREIKKQLNKLRKNGDPKDKLGNLSAQPEIEISPVLDSENVTGAPVLGTRASTTPAPDTTSTPPTTTRTTFQSMVSDESKSVQTTSRSVKA